MSWSFIQFIAELQKVLKATGYKYFISFVFIYNKEDSVISVLNNMRTIKPFFNQLKLSFVLHRF